MDVWFLQCRFIFRFEGLDLGRLATAFALLRLPRMPELAKAGDINFVASSVDPNNVKVWGYRSAIRA